MSGRNLAETELTQAVTPQTGWGDLLAEGVCRGSR
jgi:hypothetical protein